MNNEFSILRISASDFVGIIVSNSYSDVFGYLPALNCQLRELRLKGRFLIDLLLVNGAGSNRFAECFFDGRLVDVTSIKVITKVPEDLNLAACQYFYENYVLIENSILSKPIKFKFKKKIAA